MKRLGSLLLAVCLLVSVITIGGIIPGNASTPLQIIYGRNFGDLAIVHAHGYVPRGYTAIVTGNLYLWPGTMLIVDGTLWVFGCINLDDVEVVGRNAWQLNSAWQWVWRLFFGGWLWGLIGWIYRLVFPLAPSDWPFY